MNKNDAVKRKARKRTSANETHRTVWDLLPKKREKMFIHKLCVTSSGEKLCKKCIALTKNTATELIKERVEKKLSGSNLRHSPLLWDREILAGVI